MLRRISAKKFHEWRVYEELEPFPGERADYNAAHIVQFLWAASGDPKQYPSGRPLSDFVLQFGDAIAPGATVKQTVEYQEMLIESWIFGNNLALEAKAKGIT